jgi:spore coat protein H
MTRRRQHLEEFLSLALILILTDTSTYCQVRQSDAEQIDLADHGYRIENTICLEISENDLSGLREISGDKISVASRLLVINNDTLSAEEISTRGQTTLYYRRKSYSFHLESEASFHHGNSIKKLKKFYVLSLSMDRNYANNRLALGMMEAADLSHLFHAYGELRINGQSEGVCMIIERPEDWAMKKKNSPLLIRRGYNSTIAKLKADSKAEKELIRVYRDNFRSIYQSLHKYEGEELYTAISTWLDTDAYMKWLAFNYFVRNGDYTDEVFLYVDSKTGRFRVIPWDYDDIFSAAPHEGYAESRKVTEGKLFFSAEDRLDRKIVSDPYLYRMYLIQFTKLLNELTPAVLKDIFEETYAELLPYYTDTGIISQSRYDRHKNVTLEGLRSDLESFYSQLVLTRNYFYGIIKDQNQ